MNMTTHGQGIHSRRPTTRNHGQDPEDSLTVPMPPTRAIRTPPNGDKNASLEPIDFYIE